MAIVGSKELSSSKRIDLKTEIPLTCPLVLNIEVANICNSRCIFCPTSDLPLLKKVGRKAQIMEESLFYKIIQDCQDAKWRCKMLFFHKDGEPLLHPHIDKLISFAKKANIADELQLVTNGIALTPSMTERLINSGVDTIRISVNGLSQEDYQKQCGISLDYDLFVRNIENLYRAKGRIRIIVKMIDFGMSAEQRQKFYDLYSHCSDICAIDDPHGWSSTGEKDYTLGKKNTSFRGHQLDEKKVCPQSFYTLIINSDGSAGACCYDWAHQTNFGDLHNQSIQDVWQGKGMYEFRKMHLEHRRNENPACRNCHAISISRDCLDGYEDEISARLKAEQESLRC